MATEVLLPQAAGSEHCFRREASAPTTSSKSSHINHGSRRRRRMQSPIAIQNKQDDRYQSSRRCNQFPGANLGFGQVKILKRGEKLSFDREFLAVDDSNENNHIADAESEKLLDLVLESTAFWSGRARAQVDSDVEKFAGPSIGDSPSPCLVPVPRFLGNKLRPSVT